MTAARPAARSEGIFGPAHRRVTAGLLLLITLVAFEAMAITTAMPTVTRDLHGLSYYGVAFSTFLIANILGNVGSGRLIDTRGSRVTVLLGLVGFAAGLLISGLAFSMAQLIAGRFVQGLAGGLLISAAYAVAGTAYPDDIRPSAIGAFSLAWVLPSLAGPPISGLLTQHVSWRAVFLVLLPLVAAALLLTLPSLAGPRPAERTPGAARSQFRWALGTAASVAVVVQGIQARSWWGLGEAIVGLGVLGLCLPRVLLPGTLRARRGVSRTVALFGLIAAAIYGQQSFVPLALSVQHHLSATVAGLPLLCSAVTWALGAWIQGRRRLAAWRVVLLRTGQVTLCVSLGALAIVLLTGSDWWLVFPIWAFTGLAAGLSLTGLSVLTIEASDEATVGRNSSSLQLTDNVLSALFTGLGGTIVGLAAAGHIGYAHAFAIQCGLMFVVAVVAAVRAVGSLT